MKRFFRIFVAALFTALIAAAAAAPAFAAGEKLSVNGAEASEGDTVTYTLCLEDCEEEIEGLQMYLFYDTQYLEIVQGSLKFPNIQGMVYNENVTGQLPFTYSSVSNKLDFSKKQIFLTVDFKVLQAGESDITYFITELYGDDMDYLKRFKFTNDVEVNGEKVVESAAPKLVKDQETIDAYQGGFINYSDGMGDPNAENSENRAVTGNENNTDVTRAGELTHQAVTGDVSNPEVTHIGALDPVEVTKDDDEEEDNNIVVPIVVGVIVLAIVALVVVRFVIFNNRDEQE